MLITINNRTLSTFLLYNCEHVKSLVNEKKKEKRPGNWGDGRMESDERHDMKHASLPRERAKTPSRFNNLPS
jgi:hypothetical protein